MGKTIPIVDYLVLDDGAPYLVANESTESGALYFDRRNADARTGKPGFRRRRVADTGVVRTFTIVHRAAPGVSTPYVSVVVNLDGGGVVKANLLNVEPTPDAVRVGMKVQLTTYVAGVDDDGTEAIAFAYEPADQGELTMDRDVWILGTSMTKFQRYPDKDLIDLGVEAALGALADGDVTIQDMDVLGAGNLAEAASGVGQRVQKQIGQTGIPVFNVANACATGATAVRCAYLAIKAGEAEMGLAVGLEKMGKMGLLGASARSDRKVFEPSGRYGSVMSVEGRVGTTLMPGVFAQAGMEYAGEHAGVDFEQFAKVAEKNHAHSTLNPLAQYQKAFSLDEVMNAEMMAYPNTLLMCCPTGDGAAALVLVSEEKLRTLSDEQRQRAVKISASVMTSDPWTEADQVQPDVNTLTREAAARAYEVSGVDPKDLDLVELHDCFATAELLHYDNLGLCDPGEAGKFIDERGPWRDGKIPVNVSGGLISKGHPLGATGVANLYEVATHLRGEAGDRQIEGAAVGLTHVIGLGSASAVHVLEKATV